MGCENCFKKLAVLQDKLMAVLEEETPKDYTFSEVHLVLESLRTIVLEAQVSSHHKNDALKSLREYVG